MKEDEKRPKKTMQAKVILIILVLILIQCTISLGQYARYNYDDYNCVDMSRDCEYFFESLGIRVWQVGGKHYDAHGLWDKGHEWIMLDFGYFAIPYESTLLLPFWNPSWLGYEDLEISPGYVDQDGTHNNQLSWKDWV